MTVKTILRGAALAAALVGVLDPSWTFRRRAPIGVEILAGAENALVAADARGRLTRSLGNDVSFEPHDAPTALVLVGSPPRNLSDRYGNVPISTVAVAAPQAPNLRILASDDPSPVRVGWAATITALVEARGLAGTTSAIVLEQRGAAVARIEHRWTRDPERLPATLRYAPPAAGSSTMTLRVLPAERETSASDNAVDLRLVATDRPFSVLVHESRPSWTTAFVRRALEEDPSFDVSSVVQASKGLEVRAGAPPVALTAELLNRFDVVLAGAPEDLRDAEIDALRSFARRRGGAVFLLPDRRPSGRYLSLLPAAQFDEVLVENPVELRTVPGAVLRAAELAVLRMDTSSSARAGAEVLASLTREGGDRAVVLAWPEGPGRIVFSGAMDAWRFRGTPDDGFGRFWRLRVAEAALSAPETVAVSMSPGVPRPGERVTIRARVRPTEFDEKDGRTRVPWVRARLVGAGAVDEVVRLWPSAEPGLFEGRTTAPAPGAYDLQVTTETGATADEAFGVVAEASRPSRATDDHGSLALIAAATGGVAVDAGDFAPLERHLRGLSSGDIERPIRPARSLWLLLAFAGLLGAEWTIRRRRGSP